jgi:hypothetical protein
VPEYNKTENQQILKLIKKLASEERIGIDEHIYPCILGIEKSDQGLIIVITLLNRKKKRTLRK